MPKDRDDTLATQQALTALTVRGWTVERRSLFDEDAVEGWMWTDSRGGEHHVVGDWEEPPPWPWSARNAFEKGA